MNTLYFIETSTPRLGRWFVETDRDSNSRTAVLELIRTREVNPVRVLEVDEEAGTVRDCLGDDDFIEALADSIMPLVRSKLQAQLATFDFNRDSRKETV